MNASVWFQIEESLTPLPSDSTDSCVWHYLPAVGLFPIALITGCIALIVKVISYVACFFVSEEDLDPEKEFSALLKDSRLWEKLGDLEERITLGQEDPDFRFGAATCTYQDSGLELCPDSQWPAWEETCLPEENRSGRSASFFHLYQTFEGRTEIISRLKKLGLTSYRFSIEWSHIQPKKGALNEVALQVYIELCKHLRDEGIAPMITLHHFSEPKWFHEEGSFENEANIPSFVDFAAHVFSELTKPYNGQLLADHFCTINEPNIEAFSRFVLGTFSPGITWDFLRAGNFLKGALKAHCATYETLKKIEPRAQIGIAHQRLSFEATNPLLSLAPRYLNRLVNETTLNFFKTGNFELKIPFFCHVRERSLHPQTDFVGLQYYVRPLIGFTGSTSYHEPMTQMPFREDPEGIYEAILEVHEAFKKPVIITESGISTHDETQRARYMERVLYATQRAQEKIGKENLRGYHVWSICRNAEWNMGMNPQDFGVYPVQKGTLDAEPRKGIQPLARAALGALRLGAGPHGIGFGALNA